MPKPTRNSEAAQARKAVKSLVNPDVPNLDIIADEITQIAEAMRSFTESRLKRETIFILIKDATGISKAEIARVLNAAAALDKLYLK